MSAFQLFREFVVSLGHIGLRGLLCVVLSASLHGCGTAPAPESSSNETQSASSETGSQRFIGTFLLADGSPVRGALVTFENGGDQDVTDDDGVAEIETRQSIRATSVRIDSAFGTFRLNMSDIPDSALVISYQVEMNDANSEANLAGVQVTASSEPEPEPSFEPSDPEQDSDTQDDDEDQDDDSNDPNKNKGDKKKQPNTVNCNGSCHEPRVPRCGNAAWELLNPSHKAYCPDDSGGKGGKKDKDKKKGNRKSFDQESDELIRLLRSLG